MSKNLITLLTAAAELRAVGASWEAVGKHVNRTAGTCGRWPTRYAQKWEELYSKAQRDRYEEIGNEGLSIMRRLLRSKEEKLQLKAAEIIMRWGPHRMSEKKVVVGMQLTAEEEIWLGAQRELDVRRKLFNQDHGLPADDDEAFWADLDEQMGIGVKKPQGEEMSGVASAPREFEVHEVRTQARCEEEGEDHGELTQPRSGVGVGRLMVLVMVVGLSVAHEVKTAHVPDHSSSFIAATTRDTSVASPSRTSRGIAALPLSAPVHTLPYVCAGRCAASPEFSSQGDTFMPKHVYYFGGKTADGNGKMKELLGGKGANLAEMCVIGIPVPAGFTITTEVCAAYYDHGKKIPEDAIPEIDAAVKKVEAEFGKKFGDNSDPLLVSVRSGAALSMPGMMNTILNLGLTDASVEGLAKKTGNPRFAYDSYRRLIDMFGSTAMGVEHEAFEHEIHKLKDEKKAKLDTDLSADDLKELVKRYKAVYKKHVGEDFPQDPRKQLMLSINAVFNSWNGNKAIEYRRIERITGLKGTAVNVQAMVFGNMGEGSGTGVAFTRDPNTGENVFYGDYLINAQGEDVVAGIRTPEPIAKLDEQMPKVYKQLCEIREKLEQHYKEMQDIEFTVQDGVLYMLQTRTGKRTGTAAVRIAVEMVKEKKIDEATAVKRVSPDSLNHLLLPQLDPKASAKPVAQGIAASPGAATGKVILSAEAAVEHFDKYPNEPIILVRKETSPEDVAGMHLAKGILTSTGGKASHAAVVARGWGKPCIVGCEAVKINEAAGWITVSGQTVKAGEYLTINGTTGDVMIGKVPTIAPTMTGDFATLMTWADKSRKLKIRTNADTPADAQKAREFGAEGIGLCRTEHMFFGEGRIVAMREMILAPDEKGRRAALAKIEPFQKSDFVGIFEAMDGYPVTIRLLDPPLHEFLPHDEIGQQEVASSIGVSVAKVKERVDELHEFNPMMGFRGCRLPLVFPEIGDMQVRAIIEAAIEVKKKGKNVLPEIMIPLVGVVEELTILKKRAIAVIEECFTKAGMRVEYQIGTMIELPRAAMTADKIAEEAEFFSFGTNDLTQMTFGFSRDDIKGFMPTYLKDKILPIDPFQTIDFGGVGELMKIGVEKGRTSRKAKHNQHLKVGICGEHGGDPDSVVFCHKIGMDYVSCSPFRVPIARLAAAQAALGETSRDK